jgi:hypothetical protein
MVKTKTIKKTTIKKVVKRIYKPKTTKARIISVDKYQTPKSRKSIKSDRKRSALPPGRRISKSGKKYTEHRQNRSDKPKTKL